MNPKERLFAALKREETDRVPCICPGGMMNMVVEEVMNLEEVSWPEAHQDPIMMAKLTMGVNRHGGFENYGVPFCMTVEAEAMGAEVYLGTRTTEPRVRCYPLKNVSDYGQLKPIDLDKGRVKVVLDALKYLKDQNTDVPIIGNLTGPISLAASLVDPNLFYRDMRKNPVQVHKLLEFVTEQLINFGKAQLMAGADIIAISDPSGTGEILGANQFNTFVLPYLNKIAKELKIHAAGGVIIHICGRLKPIYPQLNELNSDAISFDSVTSVSEVAAQVHNKAIMGNVSTYAIEKGEKADIVRLSENCIRQGVHILSPACGIGAGTRMENIRALVSRRNDHE